MSIKSDQLDPPHGRAQGMIEPFEPGQVRERRWAAGSCRYGTSSYGYDIRCAREFKIFTNINSTIVDPKAFDEKSFVDVDCGRCCIIPPNSFALARTVEYFRIPRSVLAVCLGQVDLRALRHHRQRDAARARMGRPRDAGVLATPRRCRRKHLRRRGRVRRCCSSSRDEVCETSYRDRGGKYQGQRGRHPAGDLMPPAAVTVARSAVASTTPLCRPAAFALALEGSRATARTRPS
jgi:dCTP deaminase